MKLPFVSFLPIETANYSRVKPSGVYPGGAKIVIDSTGSPYLTTVLSTYSAGAYAPHFTLDTVGRTVYQHLELTGSAPMDEKSPQAPHKRGQVIWVCITKSATEELGEEDTRWVGEMVAKIAAEVGIPTDDVTDFPGVVDSRMKAVCMAPGTWINFTGIASAGVVPHIARYGPGKFNREAFIQGLQRQKVAAELVEFPAFRGRPVSEGSKGKRVELVQTIFDMEPTGVFDDALAEAVIAFKQERGLGDTPIVDAKTWKALGKYYKAKNGN